MDTESAVALLTNPEAAPEERYQAHADLAAAAAAGDREAEAALRWLRWNRSDRTACDVDE
ncbi:hypothetical protein [Saccharothrix obliqua]|uniref:hypothetical protein n=1 Tax=Saccharothrix obliqua TaxID=2861747 RepID=UPI001C5E5085|nr:hypothetical protein [Saccharothrix obliqua]MBW4717644.1 hypothetical protein [Saccharothrix obliqua]